MTQSLHDHNAILSRFRDWLTQTSEEIDFLAELQSADERDPGHAQSVESPARLPRGGLLLLAEAFTALRHEIKLHTRGTRNLEAMVEQSLNGLESASREFRSVQAKELEAGERAARPVVDALIGLDEGMLRATRAFRMTCDRITASVPLRTQQCLDRSYSALPGWRRVLNRKWYNELRSSVADTVRQAVVPDFASLMQGLEQIQSRLNRALQELGIVRMNECGGMVDPGRMTVIEVIESDRLPAETVVEVVRPGYSMAGQVIRFAEVRAVVGVRSTLAAVGEISQPAEGSVGFHSPETSAADRPASNIPVSSAAS